MLDSQINPIHTPCKNCAFAVYDANTQVECAIRYLDKYKQKNTQLLEAYDDDKEFYIINGKKCLGYRENKWFKQFDLENASVESKVNKYFETNFLDYCTIIDLKNLTIDDLDSILQQLSECSIKPRKLIMVRYVDNELNFSYTRIEQLLNKYAIKYTWRIQTIVDKSLTQQQVLHNLISLNSQYRFILSINNTNSDIARIISKTNTVVHEDLDQFEIFCNESRSVIIFSGIVYRFEAFHGNNLLDNSNNYTII